MADPDCLFCRILAGEIPSTEVASSEAAYAFRDVHPAAPTHVLLIPRRHVTNASYLTEGDGELLSELFALAREVAKLEGVDESGYRLVFNVGEDALNSVPHLHLHLIGGRKLGWPPG
jgi:histidine triad (HIT) family protein